MLVMMAITVSELMNKSKPGSNGSNKNAILIFLFFTSPAPYDNMGVCSRSHFFTIEMINKFESLYTSPLHLQSVFLSVSQLVYRNSNSHYRLPLLFLGGIILNPGPFHNLQPLDHEE